jgi:NAD(P)-dependent dehydrogenase (short-subunit alcohol dehydrogenase family)
VAIVTGAGRGIGRAEALALAAEGAAVVVMDLGGEGEDVAAAVAEEIRAAGGRAVAAHGDVANYDDAANTVKAAVESFGKLDILVNNAGITRDRMVFNMTEAEWDAVIAVHLRGHFCMTKHAGVLFRQQRSGVIVNTASVSGLGSMGQANYSAAKEGIVGFTRTVALDLGRYGVRCNAVRPHAATRMTMTPELQAAWERQRTQGETVVGADLPPIYESQPEVVGTFVAWLVGDAASHINGRTFFAGGDRIALYSDPKMAKMAIGDEPWTVDRVERAMRGIIPAG